MRQAQAQLVQQRAAVQQAGDRLATGLAGSIVFRNVRARVGTNCGSASVTGSVSLEINRNSLGNDRVLDFVDSPSFLPDNGRAAAFQVQGQIHRVEAAVHQIEAPVTLVGGIQRRNVVADVVADGLDDADGDLHHRLREHAPQDAACAGTKRIITAAGVSSGIDMALRLLELLVDDVAARASQLMIEYDPQPPFDAGSPEKAPPETVAQVRELAAART